MSPGFTHAQVEDLLPGWAATLALLDRDRGWALLARHAEREAIPPGSFGDEVDLTPRGVAQTAALGSLLRGRLSGTSCSPLLRCERTARGVALGAGRKLDPAPDRLLGDPGAFISDAVVAGAAFRSMTLDAIVASLMQEETTPKGMRSALAGSRLLIAAALRAVPSPGPVHLLVTHDVILLPVLAILMPDRPLASLWPGFLEGVALAEDPEGLHVVFRGARRLLPGRP